MISILTDPVPCGRWLVPEIARKAGRFLRNTIKPPKFNYGRYRGHYAVTRSLVEGLIKAGLPHNYNPQTLGKLYETVVVLAGVRTLQQAIELKKQGYIKQLYAGPNIVVFPSDCNSLLTSPEVDVAITPCNWVTELYESISPNLINRCWAWPAGVDVDYWKPVSSKPHNSILIFEKQNKGPVGPIAPYAEYLRQRGYLVEVLKYGSFTHKQYLKALQGANLMLGFVVDESQGLAWAEAWAADVPTLIWRNEQNTYRGRTYHTSSAPYLEPENGLFFDDFEDFKQRFSMWESNPEQFSPRAWALTNMSDEVCARRLYEKVVVC